MQLRSRLLRGALILALATGAAAPSSATTLIRQSLVGLVAGNATIVVGEVLDAHSYWNEDHTFILTDVRVRATEVLRGDPGDTDFTVTLMGGTVDDLTTIIVAGAELLPGKSYVMFLNDDDLPGVKAVRTVRHHSQGVFEIVKARDGVRAISQAQKHPLHPDALGFVDPPGGAKGLLLDNMKKSVREIAARQGARQEVQ
ncbi:MAG TPA: hypothetical protein VF414_21905 [Thermoanaerobaculia bacterium]